MIFDEKKFDSFICELAETRNINWPEASRIRENLKTGNLSFLAEEPVYVEYNHKVVKAPEMIANFIGDYEVEFMDGYTSRDSLLEMILDNWKRGYSEEYMQESHWISNNLCKFIDAVRLDCEVEEEPKYYIKVGDKLYFQKWGEDGICPVFEIDDAQGELLELQQLTCKKLK